MNNKQALDKEEPTKQTKSKNHVWLDEGSMDSPIDLNEASHWN